MVDDTIKLDANLKVFISHRSVDIEVANMVFDFLVKTGISRDSIFCSSLPGNDVNEKISAEIKASIRTSKINIAILSREYYKSAYCQNEAGIFWFCDNVPVIPIALPEITTANMYGFLDKEYKVRRLNSDTDISFIYDAVSDAIASKKCKACIIMAETSKLKQQYENYLSKRPTNSESINFEDEYKVTADDEGIVLYYILTKKIRKVNKEDIISWMIDEELHDVNVDNAFDLLSSIENSKYSNNVFELDVNFFRRFIKKCNDWISSFSGYVENHRILSKDVFISMWTSKMFDDAGILFICYIIDERITTFGDRWMAEPQVEDIKEWESKHDLDTTLSLNYGSCLSLFIEKRFVFESDWTSYGNPRAYSLCKSLTEFLFNHNFEDSDELRETKLKHLNLPFDI